MTMIYSYLNHDNDLHISEPWQRSTDIWTIKTKIYRYLNHDNDLQISEPWQWSTDIWTMTMIYIYLNHDNDLQISEPWQWSTDIWTMTMIYRYLNYKDNDLQIYDEISWLAVCQYWPHVAVHFSSTYSHVCYMTKFYN